LDWNSKENGIPNSISTLTHLRTFKLIGIGQVVNINVDAITSLHNQIQTCIIDRVQLTSNLNDKSNPIYTLTKLQHLELIGCEISELNETISKLTSLQTLLLSYNSELNRLPSSMTKLTSLLHLSLNLTNIKWQTDLRCVSTSFTSSVGIELDISTWNTSITNLSTHITSTSLTFIKWNHITSNTNWITHSITHSQIGLLLLSQQYSNRIGTFDKFERVQIEWNNKNQQIFIENEELDQTWSVGVEQSQHWNDSIRSVDNDKTETSLILLQQTLISSELYCLSNLTQFGSQFKSNHTHLKTNQQTHLTSISQFIIKSIDWISWWYLITSSFEWIVD
jgi:Leucine-rich repeat (LRR) protein